MDDFKTQRTAPERAACDCGAKADPVLAATGKPMCRGCYMAQPGAPAGPVYTSPASYFAALETHGATAGDAPKMTAMLRAQEGLHAGLMVYIEDAVQACGSERVSGEPLAQVIRRLIGELQELRAWKDSREAADIETSERG